MTGLGLALAAVILCGLAAGGAHAQLGVGQPAEVRSVDVMIEDVDRVRVIHEVAGSDATRYIQLIDGTATDIEVVDGNGDEVEHGESGGFGAATVTIFPTGGDVFVKYVLDDALYVKDGTVWTWDFLYRMTVTFHLPESVEVAFVNNGPVYLADDPSFNCHGCQMLLEFVPDEKKTAETLTWDGEELEVEVWTSAQIGPLGFDQQSRSISYEYEDSEGWVTLVIPQEMLQDPYQALFNGEKVLTQTFGLGDGRQGISLKLTEAGTVSITSASAAPDSGMVGDRTGSNDTATVEDVQTEEFPVVVIAAAAMAAVAVAAAIMMRRSKRRVTRR